MNYETYAHDQLQLFVNSFNPDPQITIRIDLGTLTLLLKEFDGLIHYTEATVDRPVTLNRDLYNGAGPAVAPIIDIDTRTVQTSKKWYRRGPRTRYRTQTMFDPGTIIVLRFNDGRTDTGIIIDSDWVESP
jgi:hypothetical protein